MLETGLETGNDYYQAWGIYLLAVVAAHLLLWRAISFIRFVKLKVVLHIVLAALLLTPVALERGESYWVPAVMAATMDALNSGLDSAMPRLVPILAVMVLLLAVFLLWSLFRNKANKKA